MSALSDTLLKPFETTARRETSANGLALTKNAKSGSKISTNIVNERVRKEKEVEKTKLSQQQADALFTIPQLNRLHEATVRGEDASSVAVTAVPSQNRVALQILSMWQPFKDLKLTFAVSRRDEELRLRAQQRVVATAEDSGLRTEMENLESEDEDAPRRVVLDLRIAHERFASSSDPSINGHLHCPNDADRSLNEAAADKIRKYRADCNNNPPNAISFMPAIASTSGGYIVTLCAFYFYKLIGKLTAFWQLQEFSLRNMTVASSTTAARRSPQSANAGLATFFPRLQHYGLILTSTAHL